MSGLVSRESIAEALARAVDVPSNQLLVCVFDGWGTAELYDRLDRRREIREFVNLVTQTGDQFYGDRAAGILGSPTTITAITNANPAVVTAANHGLGVGDVAVMSGVTPSAYNASWVVTAVTTNTLSINVGTPLGAGTAFGTVKGLTTPPATGMRLGTGTTAVSKTGAGAAIVTYTTGSRQALDASYPLSSLNRVLKKSAS